MYVCMYCMYVLYVYMCIYNNAVALVIHLGKTYEL